MKSFKGVCLWDSLFVSGLNQCRTWNCFACYGIFSEVGTAILAGSVLQNLYYLSPSGAIIVTSQWGHLVACGAGIALDREYQCRSLYGLENWAFITNACTNAKDFTCSKLNWNDVPRFMLPAVFYKIQFIRDVNFPTILKCMNTNFQTMFFFSIMSHKVPVVQWFILLKTKATQANRPTGFLFFFFFFFCHDHMEL